MAGLIQIVVGGQFGSEGKGHCAGELARRAPSHLLAIRTGGPNAGHTVYDENGRQFKLRQMPVASVTNRGALLALSAGSVVDLDLLGTEMKDTACMDLWVDPAATILEPKHAYAERIDPDMQWGSTKEGIGAARADRIHRTAQVFGGSSDWVPGAKAIDVSLIARNMLMSGGTVQIEAAQGYGLGLHTPFYPKTTSADCRAIDALADVGLSPWEFPDTALEVWVVIRPYPIRVAGDSGPLNLETSWEVLGLPEERTTVTNKVRRVGGWDPDLVAAAVVANGTRDVKLWMNMGDHVFPWLSGKENMSALTPGERHQVQAWVQRVSKQVGAPVHAIGTGPSTSIMMGD